MVPIKDVGRFEQYWWGMRWILRHKDVKKIRKKKSKDIDKASKITIAISTVIAGVCVGTELINPLTGLGLVKLFFKHWQDFKLFLSQLKEFDKGKGVIVDFRATYKIKMGGMPCIQIGSGFRKFSSR